MQRELSSALLMSLIIILFLIPLASMTGEAKLFPSFLIACMTTFNLIQYLMAYVRRMAKTDSPFSQNFPYKRVISIFSLTIFSLYILDILGFYFTSWLFFILSSLIAQPQKLGRKGVLMRTVYATCFVGFLYVLFTVLLKVQIPKGIFI